MIKITIKGNKFFSWKAEQDFQNRYESISYFFDEKFDNITQIKKFSNCIFLKDEFWHKFFEKNKENQLTSTVNSHINNKSLLLDIINNLSIDCLSSYNWDFLLNYSSEQNLVIDCLKDKLKEHAALYSQINIEQFKKDNPQLEKLIQFLLKTRFAEVLDKSVVDITDYYFENTKFVVESLTRDYYFPRPENIEKKKKFINFFITQKQYENDYVNIFITFRNEIVCKDIINSVASNKEKMKNLYPHLLNSWSENVKYYNANYPNDSQLLQTLFEVQSISDYSSFSTNARVLVKSDYFSQWIDEKKLNTMLDNPSYTTKYLSTVVFENISKDFLSSIPQENVSAILKKVISKINDTSNNLIVEKFKIIGKNFPDHWALPQYWKDINYLTINSELFRSIHKYTAIGFDNNFLEKLLSEEKLNTYVLHECFLYKKNNKNASLLLKYAKALQKIGRKMELDIIESSNLFENKEFVQLLSEVNPNYQLYLRESVKKPEKTNPKIKLG